MISIGKYTPSIENILYLKSQQFLGRRQNEARFTLETFIEYGQICLDIVSLIMYDI